MSSDNHDQLQRLINARVSERLNFLDPELEATHSRIDVLETICKANTDRIESVANRSKSKSNRQRRTDSGESLTLLGLGLTKINTVLANFNNPRPSLILHTPYSDLPNNHAANFIPMIWYKICCMIIWQVRVDTLE